MVAQGPSSPRDSATVPAPHARFPHLFSPIAIKGVELHNRIAITAHYGGWFADADGLPSDALRAYVEERARGGVGLFVIGATTPRSDGRSRWMLNTDDRIIPRYQAIADSAHRHGCRVFAQFVHMGDLPQPGAQPVGERPAVPRAPGAPPARAGFPTPPHTVEELHAFTASFGRAAARVVAGGVDGVELHAHEYFLHADYLSPRWNIRTDQYGGSLENRARLLVETLRAMRSAIGPALPLGVRLKADDLVPGGMGLEDYAALVRHLDALALVDYYSFTAGDYFAHFGTMDSPPGEWLPLAARLRQIARVPVMHAGRITDPFQAEQAVASGQVDVVGMTRAHIADPHFVRKVAAGALDDVRYCMGCLQSCVGKVEHMTCVYNPLTGREREWSIPRPAARRKRVVVVGAGPAGMEAALVASRRGHEVIVVERAARAGGQVWAAAGSPLRKRFGEVAAFYERQAGKGLFEVRLNTEADGAAVEALHPDAVVVATGATPRRAGVPTAGGPRSKEATTVLEALAAEGPAATARHAVIVDREGHMRAFVVADFLSDRGVDVEFLTPFAEPGPSITTIDRGTLCERLAARGVRFRPGEDILWWHDATTLMVHDVYTAARRSIAEVDLLVIAADWASSRELATDVAARMPHVELHLIGDACAPRTVEEATYQGARVGHLL